MGFEPRAPDFQIEFTRFRKSQSFRAAAFEEKAKVSSTAVREANPIAAHGAHAQNKTPRANSVRGAIFGREAISLLKSSLLFRWKPFELAFPGGKANTVMFV